MDNTQRQGQITEALTFDDVLLQPGASDIIPKDVKIVSSPMDTVTEAQMAIAMAREGGIGIIHKSLTPEAQASQVKLVKRSEHGVIADPVTCRPNDVLRDIDQMMAKYHISGVPVVGEKGELVGIITNRDLRFEENLDQKVSAVMTKDKLVTAAPGTTLDEAKQILAKYKIEKVPIVDKDGVLRGLITLKDIEKVVKYPNSAKDSEGRLLVGAAVGVTDGLQERVSALVEAGVDVIVVDSAHGHAKAVVDAVAGVKKRWPKLQVIGGNVAMRDGSPDRYFQDKSSKLVPEGIEGRVPHRGPLAETLYQLIGGLRSGMGYTGSHDLKDLRTNAKFRRITSSGVAESHPHDVTITREAPNYMGRS
jgi:IMP dehydrogenase